MTHEEALCKVKGYLTDIIPTENYSEVEEIIEVLEQKPCSDTVSRQEVLDQTYLWSKDEFLRVTNPFDYLRKRINSLQPVTPQSKTMKCKDCKWWKDSDGTYRRGVRAESQCPINCREVYEGNGYCFRYVPQESREKK